jgi:hypothetical protein
MDRTAQPRVSNASSILDLRLVVQNDVQQRTVDFDAAIVVDEAQLSKFVHEETHARAGRSDHQIR